MGIISLANQSIDMVEKKRQKNSSSTTEYSFFVTSDSPPTGSPPRYFWADGSNFNDLVTHMQNGDLLTIQKDSNPENGRYPLNSDFGNSNTLHLHAISYFSWMTVGRFRELISGDNQEQLGRLRIAIKFSGEP
jgi:hypothetical protein